MHVNLKQPILVITSLFFINTYHSHYSCIHGSTYHLRRVTNNLSFVTLFPCRSSFWFPRTFDLALSQFPCWRMFDLHVRPRWQTYIYLLRFVWTEGWPSPFPPTLCFLKLSPTTAISTARPQILTNIESTWNWAIGLFGALHDTTSSE